MALSLDDYRYLREMRVQRIKHVRYKLKAPRVIVKAEQVLLLQLRHYLRGGNAEQWRARIRSLAQQHNIEHLR